MKNIERMNFITIDFETANRKLSSACEVGIAKFSNNKLIEEYSYLIRPKNNKFDWFNTNLHGISEETVENEPEFNVIYDKIKGDLENFPIFAHNATFDFKVLTKCLDLYDLTYPTLKYGCSYRLSKQHFPSQLSYKLNTLCKENNIILEGHHRALADARACGELICIILNDLKLSNIDELESKYNFKFAKIDEYNRTSLSKELDLSKVDCTNADKDGIFYNQHVVFTGTLESMVRKEAQVLITQKGGISSKGINKQTNFLILGEQDYAVFGEGHKSTKIKKAEKLLADGQKIELLTESQFLELL